MELGMRVVKYMLFIFNLLFAVSGIALIVTGAVIRGFFSQYLDFLGDGFIPPFVLFIVVGVIVFFVAFFGCCGAIRENPCMIITFAVLLSLVFLCELAGGIAGYVFRSQVNQMLAEHMMEGLQNFNRTGYEGVTQIWDVLQRTSHCCGIDSYTEWFATPYANGTSRVPDSCCLDVIPGCGNHIDVGDVPNIHQRGCLDGLADTIRVNAGAFAGVGIGIAVIQLIGILFASLLAKSIQRYSPVSEGVL